ncbi:MAG: HK97 family phage prohead protease, partial [Paraburkholderia fungorum]|nr:HK97 family phage prohead protease [Paraburkholderia fungorum]
MPVPANGERNGASQSVRQMPLQTRLMPVSSVNAENRTADVTWTTGAQVVRYDWMRDRSYLEELSTDAGSVRMDRLQSGNAPVLNNHDRWSGLDSVLGVIASADVDSRSATGSATLRFSKRQDVEPYFQDVQDGILRNVSVGYITYRVDMIPPGQEGNDQWIYRAIDWEPYEISVVAIPADAGSTFRSAGETNQRSFPCEFVERGAGLQPTGADASQRNLGAVMPENENNQQPTGTTTVQTTTPAQPAGAQAQATDAARSQAATEERQRVIDIRTAVRASVLDNQQHLIDDFIDRGVSVDAARTEVLRLQAERSAANPQRGAANIVTVTDETDTRRSAMTDALIHRINPRHELNDAARQYRGLTLREICRAGLEAANVNTRGLDVREIAGLALGMSTRGGYSSTSDLPTVFGNVINRTLRDAYTAAPRTFQTWARQGTLTDFRAA